MGTTQLAVLVAEFNRKLVDAMVRAAHHEANELGANVTLTARVPGSYETPLAADAILRQKDVDGLVVLGYIERGETLHGEVMGYVVHRALVEASLRYRKPVGLGFIGPGATLRHAERRKDEYARAAVRAVVRMLLVISEIDGHGTWLEAAPRRRRTRR